MKHTSWTIKIGTHEFTYKFDTFITPEGKDRAIKNTIRATSVILLITTGILFPSTWCIPTYIIGILFLGITNVYYYTNNKTWDITFWE